MATVSSSTSPGAEHWPPAEQPPVRGVRQRLLRLVRPAPTPVDLDDVDPELLARVRRARTVTPRGIASVLASLGAASCTIAGVHTLAGDGWALVAGGAFLLLLERRLS